jgi:hypothetical protein
MQFLVLSRVSVQIPDDELPQLAQAVRDRWSMNDLDPVPVEDILIEAERQELIRMPENWHTDDDDLSPAELLAFAKPKKKRGKKK